MSMNQTLETCINEMRGLADADQARISKILTEILTDLRCTGTFRAVMGCSDYRAYVEGSVASGVADLNSGRVYTHAEIKAHSAARLTKYE